VVRGTWPTSLSYKGFFEWFEIEVSDTTVDLGKGLITIKEMNFYCGVFLW